MKNIIRILVFLTAFQVNEALGQTLYGTSTGEVKIYSDTPLETIEALNQKVGCLVNPATMDLAVQMKITDFVFPNKLMQEHFNENYMESEKYPTANFKGKIKEQIDFKVPGTYPVTAIGSMTIHGVTKPFTVKGNLISSGNSLKIDFKFLVKPEDYNIEIPSLVITKIAEEIEVTGNISLQERKSN